MKLKKNRLKRAVGTAVCVAALVSSSSLPVYQTVFAHEIESNTSDNSSRIAIEKVKTLYNTPIEVKRIAIDQPSVELKTGGFTYLKAALKPSNATNKDVHWESGNPKVAKVEEKDGKVILTAIEVGETVITATTEDGKHTATSEVTVSRSFDVDGDGLLLKKDTKMVAKYAGSNERKENWDEAKKADLNEDGKVTGRDIKLIKDKLKEYDNYPYKHVFVIGLDGAGNEVKEANAPNLKQFFAEGAVTYSAQAMTPTISAQNWGSILHGVNPDKHGLTNTIAAENQYPEGSPYPSFMKILKQARPQANMAAFSNWTPINYGIIEQSTDAYMESLPDDQLAPKIAEYIRTKGENTRITFVQLDDLDYAGHSYGYGSEKYFEQYKKTDENVGIILDAISDTGLMDESLIIITTDHGGTSSGSHGGNSPDEKNIFWAVHGPGIKQGTMISTSMTNMDTATIVVNSLRLDRPDNWDAKIPEGLIEEK